MDCIRAKTWSMKILICIIIFLSNTKGKTIDYYELKIGIRTIDKGLQTIT